MKCREARDLVLERQGRPLPAGTGAVLDAHLAICPACSRVDRAERALTDVLAARLPRGRAPASLVQRVGQLASRPATTSSGSRRRSGRWAWIGGGIAAGAFLVAIGIATGRLLGTRGASTLEAEAVNDHLRVLVAQHPLEIEGGGTHQVKPWFEGKLDFSPVVPDLGGAGVVLRGGAVGYFHDRRAALVQYQLRAHLVTLVIFQSDGLPLAGSPHVTKGDRGFHVALWRTGALGYALVADVDPAELERVAARVALAAADVSPAAR